MRYTRGGDPQTGRCADLGLRRPSCEVLREITRPERIPWLCCKPSLRFGVAAKSGMGLEWIGTREMHLWDLCSGQLVSR
jgi:hypothetical protein